jgi:recombination protein RecA
MTNHALARLETALRARKLDRTLTTALPPLEQHDESALIATDVATLDRCLRGGLPRGQLSEIVGPQSSGCTTLILQMIAASTRRGEIAALVDTFDRLDVTSAADAGIDLDRLLWIRGMDCRWGSLSGGPDAAINRALKALNLVLQAGGFACVVLDVADAPLVALERIPFTTWLRVQRVIEGSETACVLVVPQPLARSAGGLTLMLSGRTRWTGDADRNRHLTGADINIRIASPRRRVDGEVCIPAVAKAVDHEPQRHRDTENTFLSL